MEGICLNSNNLLACSTSFNKNRFVICVRCGCQPTPLLSLKSTIPSFLPSPPLNLEFVQSLPLYWFFSKNPQALQSLIEVFKLFIANVLELRFLGFYVSNLQHFSGNRFRRIIFDDTIENVFAGIYVA